MPDNENIRLIMVDDHPVVLEGLSVALSHHPHITVMGTAVNTAAGKTLVEKGGYDILVTDLYLNEKRDGLVLLRHADDCQPDCKKVVLTYSTIPDDVFDANEAGADAYLIKDSELDELVDAFMTVWQGGRPPLPPGLEVALWQKVRGGKAAAGNGSLSARELEVLRLMTEGCTNQEIAGRLFLSDRVIRRSNTAIFRKLQVRNRSEAVAKALREKLV